jgi:sugar-specific transcriptional regulator TrmB
LSEQPIKQILREIGMADREADVYLYLAKSDAQPAATIARGLAMHKAQVYRLVKNLQTKGFLEASLENLAISMKGKAHVLTEQMDNVRIRVAMVEIAITDIKNDVTPLADIVSGIRVDINDRFNEATKEFYAEIMK